MQFGIVPEILKKQQDTSYIQNYPRFYTDKYRGLVWQLIVLAEMGAEANLKIKEQCEYIFNNSQETKDGGFAMNRAVKKGGGRINEVIPCLTGNMVFSLIQFGYLEDLRLQNAISWIIRFMRYNDGTEEDPQVEPYDRYEMCWGKHTCLMGVVKALKGLSAIPQEKRTSEVNDAISKAAEFLLIHHIHKRSHNLQIISKPGWKRFSFPLMYQTDVLEVLDILMELGIKDKRMDEAIGVVCAKRDGMGRWKTENTANSDRLLIPIGQKDEQSKWLTLKAMRVLKRYYKEVKQ